MRSTGRVGAVTAAALAFPGAAAAAGPLASLPSGWSHASVNVVGAKGKGHTVVYDRGKVTAVGPAALTLKELDGSVVTVAVASNATVELNGETAQLSQVEPGDKAMTMGIDGAPVTQIQVTVPPSPPLTTQGKVLVVGLSSLTLKEEDGSVVTITVSPDATVKVNGRAGSLSQVQRGFSATMVTVGGLPARTVRSNGKFQSPTPLGATSTSTP
jgi:hypothetical protein